LVDVIWDNAFADKLKIVGAEGFPKNESCGFCIAKPSAEKESQDLGFDFSSLLDISLVVSVDLVWDSLFPQKLNIVGGEGFPQKVFSAH
jgi:hypothetical protein